jgi:uncharacterized protein (DUF305 family)
VSTEPLTRSEDPDGSSDPEDVTAPEDDAVAGDITDHDGDEAGDESDEAPVEPQQRLIPLVTAVLAGLLALAVGFAAGFFLGTPNYPGDDSPEAGFARDMSVHHAQAVEMGMIGWQRATLPEIRTLAYDIATTQQAQIGLMRGWLDKWGLSPSSEQSAMSWMDHGHLNADGLMPGMATPVQIEQLKVGEGAHIDIQFCRLMIDHHTGGVHMAEEVIKRTDDHEVRELAEGMIRAQQAEITTLNNLLAIAQSGP